MTNRNSHGHGTKHNAATRPKSSEGKRKNKINWRANSEARQNALKEALAQGNA